MFYWLPKCQCDAYLEAWNIFRILLFDHLGDNFRFMDFRKIIKITTSLSKSCQIISREFSYFLISALFALIVLLSQDGSIFLCVFIFKFFVNHLLRMYKVHYNDSPPLLASFVIIVSSLSNSFNACQSSLLKLVSWLLKVGWFIKSVVVSRNLFLLQGG